jgi:hypothetical protein
MATFDFRELGVEPVGEHFEALVRLLGERFGLQVQWTGRGADGGRDLVFIETQAGPLKTTAIRWLVSCKDNSQSNRSISEKDVGSIVDKVRQHKCEGFLLATTTTVSSGLKELLDRLDPSAGGEIQTKVWDRFEITKMLLLPQCEDLVLQFFPEQKKKEAVARLEEARQIIEASVPRFISGKVRECLIPFSEREKNLAGGSIWPHDEEQAKLIDELAPKLVRRTGIPAAVEQIELLDFDAFTSLVDRLIRNFPDRAKQLLRVLARRSQDSAIVFNAIEILRESDDFSLDRELEITKRCDPDTLFELYRDMTYDSLQDVGAWNWRLPSEVERYDDNVEVESATIEDLEFEGGDAINLSARLTLEVSGSSSDPCRPSRGRTSFDVKGYWLYDGIEIESIK